MLEQRIRSTIPQPGGAPVQDDFELVLRPTHTDRDRSLEALGRLVRDAVCGPAARPRGARSLPVFDLGFLDVPSPDSGGAVDLGRPSFPIRLDNRLLVVGPLCPPGGRPCPRCVETRWRELRPFGEREALEEGRKVLTFGANPRAGDLALDTAGSLVAAALEVDDECAEIAPAFWVLHLKTLHVSRYHLVPDGNCKVCGAVPDDAPILRLELAARRKPAAESDRLVAVSDYPFIDTALVNPVAGMLGRRALPGFDNTVNAPVSGSFAVRSQFAYHDSWWSGQSTKFSRSRRLGFLEGMERHAGMLARGRRVGVHASFDALGEPALDPRRCGLYEEAFYRFNEPIYMPFAADRDYYWVWAYSLAEDRPILVPEQMVYYLDHRRDQPNFVQDCSNGCATGSCFEEAMLHGLLELIERDSFLITWFARLSLPRIEPTSSANRETLFMADRIDRLGYDLHLFDMRLDLPVPSVLGLAVRRGDGLGKVVVAAGASLDPESAMLSAVSEVASYIPGFASRVSKELPRVRAMAEDPTKIEGLLDHALVYGLPGMERKIEFLFDGRPARPVEEVYGAWRRSSPPRNDLRDDLQLTIDTVRELGLDVVVADQTSPEQRRFGLATACVIVPGFMPMDFGWYRQRIFDLPRLRELPWQLGRADAPLGRLDLNPDPHPFP